MNRTLNTPRNNVHRVGKYKILGGVAVESTFFLEQYRYEDKVVPEPGDIVLDIGAYVGEASLWFSSLIGPKGIVYAFEPEPSAFQGLQHNLEANNIANVIPVNMALSDKEGSGTLSGSSGASVLTDSKNGVTTKVTTVDKFVEREQLKKVNFLKMDVEGYELNVLTGASQTIQLFKPKLAVCVYHKGNDLITIPQFIKSINPSYKLYLRQCTPTWPETVLYAEPANV